MKNVLLIVAMVALALAGVLWMTWHLAYGMGGTPTGRVSVEDLRAPVNVHWLERDVARVQANSEEDALAGLGFVHAAQHPWRMLLWRQTALGELGQWMGDSVLVIDAHTRQLGLDRIAFDTYRQMDEANRALLDAYARGINAALNHRDISLNDALITLDVRDVPAWAPWHTLALERLVNWTTTPLPGPEALDSLATPDSLRRGLARTLADSARTERDRFLAHDRRLRDFLHLRGFENSLAWAVPTDGQTFFAQRHVYGATALPVFQDVVLDWDGRSLYLTSIPGTLMFPAGRDGERAWAVLLGSDAEYAERDARDRPQPLFARVRSANGVERLIESERTADALLFLPATDFFPAPPDTTAPPPTDSLGVPLPRQLEPYIATEDTLGNVGWQVTWPGFQRTTDWPAWRHLLTGQPGWPAFSIQSGDGLGVLRNGQTDVLGTPAFSARVGGGVLVGGDEQQRFAAAQLDSLVFAADTMATPSAWTLDAYSPWAAALAPAMTSLIEDRDDLSASVDSARTYLTNWDARYDPASIGASLFEAWMWAYEDSLGALPNLRSVQEAQAILQTPEVDAEPAGVADDAVTDPDEDAFARALLRQSLSDLYVNTLSRAVDWLEAEFGTDQSQWRWENVQPTDRPFAGWHATYLPGDARDAADGRYRPVESKGIGHPTTLRWGPSLLDREAYAPGVRSLWISTAHWDEVFVRRNDPRTGGFLARYLPTEDRLRPHLIDLAATTAGDPDVRLRPAAR